MVARTDQQGFSLVELVAAFAVLSIMAVALVHTGHGRTQSMSYAFHETVALRLAQAELEAQRANPEPLMPGVEAIELPSGVGPLPGGRGQRSVRVIQPQLFEVEVQVWWLPAGAKQAASVSLTTRLVTREVN